MHGSAKRPMTDTKAQLAYLNEHQAHLEDQLVKAMTATVNARTADPLKFLASHLAEAAGLVVRLSASRRMRSVGIRALLLGATMREVVGLRQWIPHGEEDHESDINPKRYESVARGAAARLNERVVHPAVRVAGHEAELARLLEHGTGSWEFDSIRLTELSGGHPLLALGWALFERHNLRDELGFSSETVLGFLSQVEARYREVPYHNKEHATDVTHGLHYLLSTNALRELAPTPLDIFACLIAAICHDLNHDGRNNAFHVNSDSTYAQQHAYESPLARSILPSVQR